MRAAGRGGKSGYSLLLKDSVIYGTGRALQKFLVALLLPLYTAFLSPADYGILGMVVAVTTFLDVFVTLGFDVAFSRFYFDDKDEAARKRVITNTFYVSTVYPAVLLGATLLLLPTARPAAHGRRSTRPATGATSPSPSRRCSSATSTTCRSRSSASSTGRGSSAPSRSAACSSRCR